MGHRMLLTQDHDVYITQRAVGPGRERRQRWCYDEDAIREMDDWCYAAEGNWSMRKLLIPQDENGDRLMHYSFDTANTAFEFKMRFA